MGTPDRKMNQQVLLRIMLRAYKTGNQSDMDLRAMVEQMAGELKPYLEQDDLHRSRPKKKQPDSKEVAG